jgi:hypothetical protein
MMRLLFSVSFTQTRWQPATMWVTFFRYYRQWRWRIESFDLFDWSVAPVVHGACRLRLHRAVFAALMIYAIVSQQTLAAIPAAVPAVIPASAPSWKAALAEGEKRLKLKELRPAEICFRDAVHDVRHDKTGSADDQVLCMESLADVLQTQDETEEAIQLYRKSLRILQKSHGKESEATVPTIVALGEIFKGEAQWRVSAKYYRQALSIVETKSGRSNVQFADIEHRLGLVTFKAGYAKLAEKMYGSSMDAIMVQTQLPSSVLLDDLLNDYIYLLRKTYGEGRPLLSAVQTELLKDRLIDSVERSRNVGESQFSKTVSSQLTSQPGDVQSDKQDGAGWKSALVLSLTHLYRRQLLASTEACQILSLLIKSTSSALISTSG